MRWHSLLVTLLLAKESPFVRHQKPYCFRLLLTPLSLTKQLDVLKTSRRFSWGLTLPCYVKLGPIHRISCGFKTLMIFLILLDKIPQKLAYGVWLNYCGHLSFNSLFHTSKYKAKYWKFGWLYVPQFLNELVFISSFPSSFSSSSTFLLASLEMLLQIFQSARWALGVQTRRVKMRIFACYAGITQATPAF